MPDDEPINTVRWSWDREHAHQWDYALNLVGRQRVDQTIRFPDFSVLAVAPDRLPDWLAAQTWQAATFVEVMKPYWTTEGVYEYSVGDDDNVLPFRYATGLDKNAPTSVFHDIPEGFRGEYSFDLSGLARIYLSPIDGNAHLIGADAGVWDLGRGREIRYENLGGEYIDHWSLLEGGRRIKDLYVASGQILLTDAAGTRIGRMSSPEAVATFAPPRDHDEWRKLRALLADSDAGPAPDDFEGMFRRVAEAPQSLKGAAIRDLRLSEDGFRFVLESDTRTPRWEGIHKPGSHVVRYVPGHGYATAPLTPAQAEVSAVSAIQETGDALEAIGLSATVGNTGGEDIRGAAVDFFAGRDDGPSVAIGSSRIDMLSGANAMANLRWTPPAPGRWTIHAAVGAVQGAPSIVAVNHAPVADLSGILAVQQLSSPVVFLAIVTLLCGALLAVSAGAGRLPEPWWSVSPRRTMGDAVRARWLVRKYRASPGFVGTAQTLVGTPRTWLVGVLGVAALAGLYFVLRPDGRWAEADTALMTDAIRTVVRAGSLSPESGTLYPSGYGYPAVSATILAFTGLDVRVLQQLVYPLISAAVVLPAWALYREVGGTVRVAAIATLFLLLIPEHLFTLLRGSHERMDRTFLLLLVWFIVRRARIGQSAAQSALHMVVILLALYGLVATNVLFAMSVAAALTMAALASWTLWRTSVAGSLARTAGVQLGWVAVAAWLLIVIFILVIYPPAMHTMDAISGLPAQIAQLISGSEGAVNPYASIPSAWVSPQVFVALSIGNLIVVMGSALTWVVLGRRWLRGERPRTGLWVLWLLYAAFAFQVALGTFVDRTGMLGGNLQYRAFAPFATLAAGLLAVGLSEIRPRAVIRVAGGIALAALAVAATLKASNEPVVSNKWTFYSPAEITGLAWADANLASTPTWIGPDERLGAAYLTELGVPAHGDRWTHDELDPSVRAFVVSDIVRLQASRMGVTLPALAVQDRVYDNGETQIYRGEP